MIIARYPALLTSKMAALAPNTTLRLIVEDHRRHHGLPLAWCKILFCAKRQCSLLSPRPMPSGLQVARASERDARVQHVNDAVNDAAVGQPSGP
jgi:hypothetical protein